MIMVVPRHVFSSAHDASFLHYAVPDWRSGLLTLHFNLRQHVRHLLSNSHASILHVVLAFMPDASVVQLDIHLFLFVFSYVLL